MESGSHKPDASHNVPVLWPQLVPQSQFLAVLADLEKFKDRSRDKAEELNKVKRELVEARDEIRIYRGRFETAETELARLRGMICDMVPSHILQDVRCRSQAAVIAARQECEDYREQFMAAIQRTKALLDQVDSLNRNDEVW